MNPPNANVSGPRRAPVVMRAPEAAPAETPLTTVSFGAILFAVRRHLWLLAAITLAVGALMVLMVRREEPVYRATAVVRIADERRSLTSGLEEADEPIGRARQGSEEAGRLVDRDLLGSPHDGGQDCCWHDFSCRVGQLFRWPG